MKVFNLKNALSVIFIWLTATVAMAQPACPAINAGPDVQLPCGTNCTNLTATFSVTGATNTYTVAPIIYTPQPYSGTAVLVHTDDRFSQSIPLPFHFCFFGNTYDSVVIGANGVLSFNTTANALQYNNWDVNQNAPTTNTPDILNAIMAPWQDIDPTLQGNIYYQIVGTAPCRMFIASWDSIPTYGSIGSRDSTQCPSPMYASSQVILYESTSIIDILIRDKWVCSSWIGGAAIEGIQNASGSAFYAVTGRNDINTPWQAHTNDAYRFTPSGAANYTIDWYYNGAHIDTGATISVCPKTVPSATYTAKLTYYPCGGSAPIVDSDMVTVSHQGNLLAWVSSSQNASCAGVNNGSAIATIQGGNGTVTYGWSDSNGNPLPPPTLTKTNLAPGSYTFTATDGTCLQGDTVTIGVNPSTALLTNPIITNATCNQSANGMVNANPSGGLPPYDFVWNPGNKDTSVIYGLTANNYLVTVTDQQGCSATASATVGQPPPLVVSATGSPVSCKGDDDGTIQVTITGGTPTYNSSATQDQVVFYSADSTGLITKLTAGSYKVFVIDNNGCSITLDDVVVPDATPDTYPITTDSTSCYGPQYNDGQIGVGFTGTNTPYMFSIDSGTLQSNNNFFNLSAGQHTITAVNGHGCITTIPVVVPQPPPIIATVTPDSITIPLGGSQQVQLTYQDATNPYFDWSPSLGLSCTDCTNPIVGPFESGAYVAMVNMVSNNTVCHGSATLYVTVLSPIPVYIPNSFTPNGDGNNDIFQVYGASIKTVDMKIYDRWGQLMFSSQDQFYGWDGRFKNEFVMPGVFIYDVNITFLDDTQVEKKGSITLLR